MPAASRLSRRAALRLAAAAPLAAATACGPPAAAPAGLAVPLASLPDGERVRVLRDDEPIELLRQGDTVTARSLWCTHVGCEVRWVAAHRVYRCPCHGAIFAADGRVLEGPPPAPLRDVAVERRGDRVVLPPRRAVPPAGGDRA